MATLPVVVGLVSDFRVCNFITSEAIGELAREVSGVDFCGNNLPFSSSGPENLD